MAGGCCSAPEFSFAHGDNMKGGGLLEAVDDAVSSSLP